MTAPADSTPPAIWIDVEDLFDYAARGFRPSGIQRLQYELAAALVAIDGGAGRVRFVRHDAAAGSFRAVPFASVRATYAALTARAPAPAEAAAPIGDPGAGGALRRAGRRAIQRLPATPRQTLLQAAVHLHTGLRLLGRFAREAGAEARRPSHAPVAPGAEAGDAEVAFTAAHPGDVLLIAGAPWAHPDHASLVAGARARGLRCALLVYDLIPIRRPEWFEPGLVRIFTARMGAALAAADIILAISRATAADVRRHCAAAGLGAAPEPVVIPVGSGFTAPQAAPAAPPAKLPAPGTYALVVATIEARKNHALLFRVWRRLLDDLPRDAVPTLVFAGRVGWLVADLMQQLHNTRFLDGKVLLIPDPDDAALRALYQGCRFTLFASFYEGWGLPATESLAFGAPCILSNATALPEAGGTLARYFDPEDGAAAYQVIRAAIDQPDDLAAWRARIAREFRPVPWTDAARAVVAALHGGPISPAGERV